MFYSRDTGAVSPFLWKHHLPMLSGRYFKGEPFEDGNREEIVTRMLELKSAVSKERKQPELIALCRDAYADFEVERNKRSRVVRNKDGTTVGPVEENWDSSDDEDSNKEGDDEGVDEKMFVVAGTTSSVGTRRRLMPPGGKQRSSNKRFAGEEEYDQESVSSS